MEGDQGLGIVMRRLCQLTLFSAGGLQAVDG